MEALREMAGPLFSCWPVVTEAAWLLRRSPRAVQQLLDSMDGSFLELLPLAGTEAQGIAATTKKYEGIRPQLADAALIYLADASESKRSSPWFGATLPFTGRAADVPFALFRRWSS